jgi:hypothetical protein
VPTHGKVRNGLRKRVTQVGILGIAAVPRPPAGVDGELHQVGQPAHLSRAAGLAAGQRAELVQIDRARPMRLQIRVDEARVAPLVIGVVVDVLAHVLVQHGESLRVRPVPGAAGEFAVLDPSELVVLLPQVSLEQLGRREELENRNITAREAPIRGGGRWIR